MSSKAERLKQEEEANALILAQSNSTPEGNTEVKETTELGFRQEAPRTPEAVPTVNDSSVNDAKYKVLQGKYNAEVPKLRDEVQSLKQQLSEKSQVDVTQYQSQIDQLTQQVTSLKTQLDAKGQQSEGDIDDAMETLTEEYGPELANNIQAMIERRVQSTGTAPGSDEVAKLQQKVDDIQRATDEEKQHAKLVSLKAMLKSSNVDFDSVDTDPLFHEWLAEEHANTGQTRQSFLEQSFAQGDIKRAAAYYTDFKAQESSRFAKNPLSQHVDAAQNHSAPDGGGEPDTWSADDIERFYSDVRKGKLTKEEIAKHEQSLNRAMQQGRVTA